MCGVRSAPRRGAEARVAANWGCTIIVCWKHFREQAVGGQDGGITQSHYWCSCAAQHCHWPLCVLCMQTKTEGEEAATETSVQLACKDHYTGFHNGQRAMLVV